MKSGMQIIDNINATLSENLKENIHKDRKISNEM